MEKKKLQDKNGRTMSTGQIVKISGAYFKNDNGLYFIEHSPGDPIWSGSDYSLRKIKKNGEPSTAKYNITFWPLVSFTNSRIKKAEARAWNKEHAEIELIEGISRNAIADHFKEEAEKLTQQAKHLEDNGLYGKALETIIESAKQYKSIAEEINGAA